MNGAFRTGFTKTNWEIEFLKSIYYLSKHSPARRGHFTDITQTSSFALKFCSIRWTENSDVADRASKLLKPLKNT